MPRSVSQIAVHQDMLTALASMLSTTEMSAAEIAKHMGCTKATAYKRVRALRGLRFKVWCRKVSGKSGPRELLWRVVTK